MAFQASIALSFMILVGSPCPASGDDAGKVFDSLYTARLKQVANTASLADDFALAKDMLNAAAQSGSAPDLLRPLCESSYQLASKGPDGYAIAVDAAKLLSTAVPSQRKRAREMLVDVLTKQSRVGSAQDREMAVAQLISVLVEMSHEAASDKAWDESIRSLRRAVAVAAASNAASLGELRDRLALAQRQEQIARQVVVLQERLLKDATDAASANELIRLFLIEQNDPVSASRYADRASDEQLKAIVRLAVQDVERLETTQCLTLGEWYSAAAAVTPGSMKSALATKAVASLDRYLRLHTADDALAVKARLLAEKARAMVQEPAKEVSAPAAPDSVSKKSVNLLANVKVADPSSWTMSKNGLRVTTDSVSMHELDASAMSSYQVKVRFTRIAGNGHAAIALPCGKGDAWIIIENARGNLQGSGLRSINGKDFSLNETAVPVGRIKTGQPSVLDATVKMEGENVSIEILLDQKPFIKWSGLQSHLNCNAGDFKRQDTSHFAFGAYRATYEFHIAELIILPKQEQER